MKLFLQIILAIAFLAPLAKAGKGKGGSSSSSTPDFCDCCRFVRRDRARFLASTDDYVDDIYDVCTASCGCQSTDGGCFSEDATVQVLQKGVISIQELKVGDKILTANHQDHYEEVYGFGHFHKSKTMEFLKISTTANSDAAPLEITGNHLVYVDGKSHPVRADSVQVGDMLRSQHDTAVLVTKIKKVTKNGVYAPLTPSGTVVVDGIVASSYIPCKIALWSMLSSRMVTK